MTRPAHFGPRVGTAFRRGPTHRWPARRELPPQRLGGAVARCGRSAALSSAAVRRGGARFRRALAEVSPTARRSDTARHGRSGGVYSYRTTDGIRWRFVYRRTDGTQTTKRGLGSASGPPACRTRRQCWPTRRPVTISCRVCAARRWPCSRSTYPPASRRFRRAGPPTLHCSRRHGRYALPGWPTPQLHGSVASQPPSFLPPQTPISCGCALEWPHPSSRPPNDQPWSAPSRLTFAVVKSAHYIPRSRDRQPLSEGSGLDCGSGAPLREFPRSGCEVLSHWLAPGPGSLRGSRGP